MTNAMPNLLDIRRRIKSVKNTQQITKAMKMVSAAKLKRAQDRVVTARPFANKMVEVLGELAKRTDEDFHHPLLDLRGDERYLLVLITADKGLCGAFNTNLMKAAQAFIKENPDKNDRDHWPIGRKGTRLLPQSPCGDGRRVYWSDRKGSRRVFGSARSRPIHHQALHGRRQASIKSFLIYNEFKSVLQQRVVLEQLLPVSRAKEEEPEAKSQQAGIVS